MRRFLATVAALTLNGPVLAAPVRGTGSAIITADVDATRAVAERDAKRQLVIALLQNAIGDDRLREVSAQKIDQLARQIRDDMIVNRSSHREGPSFIVDLDADVDSSWFAEQLSNLDIASSSERASNGATILVMLDTDEGMVSDFNKPAEQAIVYDHQVGGSYSDHSAEATSERDASGSSSKSAYGYSGSSSAAYGVSGDYGSAAATGRGRLAGAAVSRSANASLHKYDHAGKTRVDAEVHDDTHYAEHTVWQRPPQNSDGGLIMAALQSELTNYNVGTADSVQPLTAFFRNRPPRLAALERDARFPAFLSSLSRTSGAQFFMGGMLHVEYSTDTATQLTRCSGALNASAFAAAGNRNVGSGTAAGSTTGMGAAECRAKLAEILAKETATKMGPQIQRYWRQQDRTLAAQSVAINTSQAADYSLVLRSSKLSMAMQADILDALQSTPGVQSQGFISQSGSEMRFAIRYAGSLPLQLALYQKLRTNPQFTNMQSSVQGRSVLLCLSGCSSK